MIPPAMPLDELRRRYEALGPLEELPGERTFFGRCWTFDAFLGYGPDLVDFVLRETMTIHDWDDACEPHRSQWPRLVALCREAWPNGGGRMD